LELIGYVLIAAALVAASPFALSFLLYVVGMLGWKLMKRVRAVRYGRNNA
jgi:hypothetical protein